MSDHLAPGHADRGGDGRTLVRAAVFLGASAGFRLEELLLDPPGPGEVRVRMLASGVCHSDLHVLDGDWERPSPVAMGHEGAGIVEALGPGVGSRPGDPGVGDLVVLAWTAPCGACPACVRGEGFLCADPRGAGHRRVAADVRLRRPDGTPVGVYSGIGTMASHQVVAAEAAIPVDRRPSGGGGRAPRLRGDDRRGGRDRGRPASEPARRSS